YARQDRRPRAARVAITAKLVADMIVTSGIDRVVTVDVHADQIQGFFDIPVDNVYASPVLLGDVWKQEYENMVVVSPDVGGVVRARALAKRLDDAELAIIDKRRPQPNMAEVMNVIGEVEDKVRDLVAVSADVGCVVRAPALGTRLDDAGLAIIDKRRPQPNVAEVMDVIGEVEDKVCVLVDDMVDTAGTLCQAARVLKERGAVRVV